MGFGLSWVFKTPIPKAQTQASSELNNQVNKIQLDDVPKEILHFDHFSSPDIRGTVNLYQVIESPKDQLWHAVKDLDIEQLIFILDRIPLYKRQFILDRLPVRPAIKERLS